MHRRTEAEHRRRERFHSIRTCVTEAHSRSVTLLSAAAGESCGSFRRRDSPDRFQTQSCRDTAADHERPAQCPCAAIRKRGRPRRSGLCGEGVENHRTQGHIAPSCGRGTLGQPEMPLAVFVPGPRFQVGVLCVGTRLHLTPVAVQDLLSGVDEFARVGHRGFVGQVFGHEGYCPADTLAPLTRWIRRSETHDNDAKRAAETREARVFVANRTCQSHPPRAGVGRRRCSACASYS
jgi:hypothetical protein